MRLTALEINHSLHPSVTTSDKVTLNRPGLQADSCRVTHANIIHHNQQSIMCASVVMDSCKQVSEAYKF